MFKKQFVKERVSMDFLNSFLWGFATFAVLYGLFLLFMPKNLLLPGIKKQLEKKGNPNPSDEDLEKRFKLFRTLGIVCILAGAVLFIIMFTGGI